MFCGNNFLWELVKTIAKLSWHTAQQARFSVFVIYQFINLSVSSVKCKSSLRKATHSLILLPKNIFRLHLDKTGYIY